MHGTLEVKAAKMNEIRNLKDYDTFEEVPDEVQETIGSHWVITQKEKHDGQKQQCKARLVAKGFQESLKQQSDSPTASRDTIKLMIALMAIERFRLLFIDIKTAFLQSEKLDCDINMIPPSDLRKNERCRSY